MRGCAAQRCVRRPLMKFPFSTHPVLVRPEVLQRFGWKMAANDVTAQSVICSCWSPLKKRHDLITLAHLLLFWLNKWEHQRLDVNFWCRKGGADNNLAPSRGELAHKHERVQMCYMCSAIFPQHSWELGWMEKPSWRHGFKYLPFLGREWFTDGTHLELRSLSGYGRTKSFHFASPSVTIQPAEPDDHNYANDM